MTATSLGRVGPDDGGAASGAAPRLYRKVFEILADEIGEGRIAPGERLNESGIAERFGVSRAPARQALAELERAGLVEKAGGRGYAACGSQSGTKVPAAEKLPEDIRLFSSASWEKIYREVEDEIIARISFAGWRVNEAKLARHYGVSRTVARDVIGRLQQRGLLQKDEKSRWYAPALTSSHIGELYELRWLLEPVALLKAAPHVTPEFLAGMRRHLEEAIQARDIRGTTLDRLEEEMHVALLGHCGNRTLTQAISLHQSLLIAHRFLYRWTPRLFETEPFLPEHMEIVERMQRGKIEAAAQALETHLRVSRERAIARVNVVVRGFNPEVVPYLEQLGRTWEYPKERT